MDLEVDDNYIVEHEDDFRLTVEQFRKLIEAKVNRNKQHSRHLDERESMLKHAD